MFQIFQSVTTKLYGNSEKSTRIRDVRDQLFIAREGKKKRRVSSFPNVSDKIELTGGCHKAIDGTKRAAHVVMNIKRTC